MDFIQRSKTLHIEQEKHAYWGGAFDPNNQDTARHYELLRPVTALQKPFPDSSWLTIGDNRGRDAGFLKRNFGGQVTASDLDAARLEPAKLHGHVDEVASVDVESIQFENDSIDFVCAKEAFHHFPRPYFGYYEMLRVARIGVVVIEPVDVCIGSISPYPHAEYRDAYESIGNYKYQVSPREFLKVAWALDLPAVGMKGLNDPFVRGMSLSEWTQKKSYLDELGEKGQRQFNLMALFVFKKIEPEQIEYLRDHMKIYLRPR